MEWIYLILLLIAMVVIPVLGTVILNTFIKMLFWIGSLLGGSDG